MRYISFFFILLFLVPCLYAQDVRVGKIWDNDYSAFPSIEKFNGKYYISFREAKSHVFDENGKASGKTRIIASPDGERWEPVAFLGKDGIDLRDPKLSVTSDGRLMVIMGGSKYEDKKLVGMTPQVSFSRDGIAFTDPEPVRFEGLEGSVDREWIWRVTWYGGVGYGVTYGGEHYALLKTEDGVTFSKVCDLDLPEEIRPGESTVRFSKDGEMHIMVRCEGGESHGRWGVSGYPYTKWEWKEMNFHLGGPDFIFLEDGTLFAGSRYYFEGGNCKTMLLRGTTDGRFDELYLLPSGGDTSYPGFIETDDELWMVYYSSHETNDTFKESTSYEYSPEKKKPRACIYLAKFKKEFIENYGTYISD